MKTRSFALSVLFAAALAPVAVRAGVDIELEGNRHVLGSSYTDQGGKLIVYRPSGAVEVDRASVRSIRQYDGDAAADKQALALPQSGASAPAVSAPDALSSATTPVRAKDPEARDRELGARLMKMRIDRLAATQRGDHDAAKKLEKDIQKFQGERNTNWKKLHPEDTSGDNAN